MAKKQGIKNHDPDKIFSRGTRDETLNVIHENPKVTIFHIVHHKESVLNSLLRTQAEKSYERRISGHGSVWWEGVVSRTVVPGGSGRSR